MAGAKTMTTIKQFNWGRWRCAYVNSANVAEVQELLFRGLIDGLGFNEAYGFEPLDSELIGRFPDIKTCIFVNCSKVDLKVLECLRSLECLSLGGERKDGFNFQKLPMLRDLSFDWNPKDLIPSDASGVKKFRVWKYKPRSKCLIDFPTYGHLDFLEIVQSNLVSLDGIEKLPNLKELHLGYARSFKSIAAIKKTKIENLDLEACSKISDLAEIRYCESLKSVRMGGCGEHPSLSFIGECKNLQEFRFVRTNFLDGNMSPLLRLKSVGFLDKKHFSHTNKQVNAGIAQRIAPGG
jgi:protein phosphatase 1 regulatory subunit 7